MGLLQDKALEPGSFAGEALQQELDDMNLPASVQSSLQLALGTDASLDGLCGVYSKSIHCAEWPGRVQQAANQIDQEKLRKRHRWDSPISKDHLRMIPKQTGGL